MARTTGSAGVDRAGGFVRLSIDIPGRERVSVGLSRWGHALTDWRPFFREYVAPAFFDLVRFNVEKQGRLVGGWAALSPAYAAWKARHYPGKTILRRTDRLYGSLAFANGQPGPEGVFRTPSLTTAEMGTAVPYARFHQQGTDRPMPARPVLFLEKGASQNYGRLMHRFVVDQRVAAGLKGAA
jgi:phage gpG-like protein